MTAYIINESDLPQPEDYDPKIHCRKYIKEEQMKKSQELKRKAGSEGGRRR
jgi:hypothetical protein